MTSWHQTLPLWLIMNPNTPSMTNLRVLAGTGDSTFSQIPCTKTSRPLLLPSDTVLQVSCGATAAVALVSTPGDQPRLLEWGTSMYGERLMEGPLLIEDLVEEVTTSPYERRSGDRCRPGVPHDASSGHPVVVSPSVLPANETICRIACGAHFVVAAVASGGCIAWGGGRGNEQQRVLARGSCGNCRSCPATSRKTHCTPSPTPDLPSGVRMKPAWMTAPLGQHGKQVCSLGAGDEHAIAICRDGSTWAWGRGDCGQLGIGPPPADSNNGPSTCRPMAVNVPSLSDSSSQRGSSNGDGVIHAVACGRDHSAVLTKGGRVLTFGSGLYGQVMKTSLDVESLDEVLCPGVP